MTAPPEHYAIYNGTSGEGLTRQAFERQCNQAAHLFRSLGLARGEDVAVLLPNCLEYFAIVVAANRTGLYVTPISSHLKSDELHYILNDCGARCLITTPLLSERIDRGSVPGLRRTYLVGGDAAATDSWHHALASMPDQPVTNPSMGRIMFYSSGTTGRPKGIRQPLPLAGSFAPENAHLKDFSASWKVCSQSTYFSPAPLYHAAPLVFSIATLKLGGCVVFTEKFDAELTLRLMDERRATHAQFVPTMFIRMLRLPEEVRRGFDLSSLECVIHAAAPCPVDVKHQIIDWFGPIVEEYYSGTERVGSTRISSREWLRYPGSVGRPSNCAIHILDDQFEELPAGEIGMVYFSGGGTFEYHGDLEKTASSRSRQGWATLGDCGYLNEAGYLFLTDRKDFMIISGGVNIYPQEIEDVISQHPGVDDVAVIGVAHPEFGQEVKAVVKPLPGQADTGELSASILAFCAARLSPVKCPRSVDFVDTLPRSETGKLQKRFIADRYRS